MRTFGELLTEYMRRTGISDSELARSIGVQRQTVFRWKEGSVARPRVREDVLNCASRLRLSPEERDLLLLAAGFAPENPTYVQTGAQASTQDRVNSDSLRDSLSGLPPVQSLVEAKSSAPLMTETHVDAQTSQPSSIEHQTTQAKLLRAEPPSFSLNQRLRWTMIGVATLLVASLAVFLPRWINPSVPETPSIPEITPTPIIITPEVPPSPTTGPTSTALPSVAPATTGESLILIADFRNQASLGSFDMAGRLQDELDEEVERIGLKNVRIERLDYVISDKSKASAVFRSANAILLIYGEFDDGRFVVRYVDQNSPTPEKIETFLDSPDQLPYYINNVIPQDVKSLAFTMLATTHFNTLAGVNLEGWLQSILALKPDTPDLNKRVLFLLGRDEERKAHEAGENWQKQLEHLNKAIESYTRLIELHPQPEREWINAWYNRGNAYTERSRLAAKGSPELSADLDAAIADYTFVNGITSSHWKAILNRGTAYYDRNQSGDLDLALVDLDRAIQLQSKRPIQYFMRGLARLRKEPTSVWESDFRTVLELQGEDVSANVALCWGFLVTDRIEPAVAECARVRVASENAAENADLQGILLAQSGKLEQAELELKRHLEWLKTRPPQLYERLNGLLVEQWISDLETGKNPFDKAVLEQLRKGE